ncbi:alcohol oxidase [Ramicandelaber brevisporus]|nr:alcohol oxidase [Ramicandelaber brevisporus]
MGLFAWLKFLLFVRSRVNTAPIAFASKTSSHSRTSLDARELHPYYDLDSSAKEYDYIICGCGTAGSVLANRLSADPSVSVLAIEAGDSDQSTMLSAMPLGFVKMMRDPTRSWQFYTEPEREMNGRAMFWPRGKMLGGCSATNAMLHQKCHSTDWNEWEQEYGCDGWSWDKIKHCSLKYERFVPPNVQPQSGCENLPMLMEIDDSGHTASLAHGYRTAVHGQDGPVTTTPGHARAYPVSRHFVSGCVSAGIPRIPDLNDDSVPTFGVSLGQRTITPEGKRVSTSTAYLSPETITARPNLTIGTFGRVTRVLFQRTSDGKPRAAGVELVDASGNFYQVRARREVIISAGAIQSPHILLLSGVGPRDVLEEHNIPLAHHLPGVGANLQDHLSVQVAYKVPFWDSRHFMKYFSLLPLFKWLWNGSGMAATNMFDALAFFNNRHSAIRALIGNSGEHASQEKDTELATAPNIEVINVYGYGRGEAGTANPPLFWTGMATYMAILLKPHSRGRVSLKSRNPLEPPRIEARYLSDARDMDVFVDAVKATRAINQHMVAAGHSYGLYDLDQPSTSDSDIKAYIRERSETVYHPTSTCAMGPASNKMAVVDSHLRVHGISGLRVVDLSVVPTVPRGHPMAVAITIGERASELILSNTPHRTSTKL